MTVQVQETVRLTRMLINGDWVESSGGTFDDLNPATGELLAKIASGGATEIDQAVMAARSAFNGAWARTTAAEKGRLLNRLADLVERDAEHLALLEGLDIGKPISQPLILDVPNAVASFRYFAGWADKIKGETIPTAGYMGRDTMSYTVREPLGVIGAIIPWNSPLMILAWKLAPALAAGNTVVVKPAEDAPLSVLHLGSLFREAGFPDGVVNIVPGFGKTAGDALVRHHDVNKITFTGSAATGKAVQIAAIDTFKRVTLELGGKSPHLIFEDADIEGAIRGAAVGLFFNQGEVCAAGTRILAHRSVYDRVVAGLAAAAEAHVMGDPLKPETTIGALVNKKQQETVLSYINKSKQEGARLVTGGGPGPGSGYFVEPTVFADVTESMTIAQEEVFGPVGAVFAFDTEEEAIGIANGTRYGLAASVWTRDVSRAHRVASKLQSGAVWVNAWGAIDPALPWGGVKSSGVGRELGWAGIVASTEEKVVTVVM